MRAHVELTPAERRLLATMTAEERHEIVTQMIETVTEELEWQMAVERARSVAASVPELVARAAPQPPPLPRYRWPSAPARSAKR